VRQAHPFAQDILARNPARYALQKDHAHDIDVDLSKHRDRNGMSIDRNIEIEMDGLNPRPA
jgi:hypothetical protein